MTVSLLSPELSQAAEASKEVICLLDSDLRIKYCNPAWNNFALNNQGQRALSASVAGAALLDVVAEPLREYFCKVFERVAATREVFEFDYECSSAELFRNFRLRVMPLDRPSGFLVVHSLRVEHPHDRSVSPPDESRYRSADGILVMCCHCRRTRRGDDPGAWDWVPAFLSQPLLDLSHGLCPLCAAYFYPEFSKH